jgi:hypothetical protein
MTAIRDLDLCEDLPLDCPSLRAVGWLDRGIEFSQGSVSGEFFEKLRALCRDPWQPLVAAGQHQCTLCQYDAPSFGCNVFVPGNGCVYVAPVGIVHYIASHWYLPPAEFISAVLATPPMRSVQYFKALIANGGRPLLPARQS